MNIKWSLQTALIVFLGIGIIWMVKPHTAEAQSYFIADSFRYGRVALNAGCSGSQSVNVGAPVLFAFVAIGADTWTGSWNGIQANTNSVVISGNNFSFSYSRWNPAHFEGCNSAEDVNWFAIVDVNPTSQKIAQNFRSGSDVLQGGCGGTQTVNVGAPVLAAFVTPATNSWTGNWQIIQIPTWGSVTWSGSSFSFPYARVNPSQNCNVAATTNWFAIVNANDVASQVASSFVSGRNALSGGCNGTQTISAGRTVRFTFFTLGSDSWTGNWQIIQIPTWGSVTWSGSSFSFPYARVNPSQNCNAAADVNWFVIDDKMIDLPVPTGTLQIRATKDGQPWDSPPFTINYTGPSGTFTVSVDSPVDIPNLPVGAYTINAVTPPAGVTYSGVAPSVSQTLSAGGAITFTFNFITIPVPTGTLQIRATKDGQPWDSPPFVMNYTGPSGTFTVSVDSPVDIPNLPVGAYTINAVTPPAGVTLQNVNGSSLPHTQTLSSSGGAITFTFNFATVVTTLPVPTLAIAPSSASVNVGGVQQFNAIYDPDGSGSQSPFSVTNSSNWSSSNASVVTVDSVGSATGVLAGSATITANYSGLTASASLTVTASGSTLPGGGGIPPLSVSCSASPTSTIVGQSVAWTATASGGAGSYVYSWSGSSPLEGKTGNPVNVSYATPGVKTGSTTVASGGSSVTNSCANSVSVIATNQPPTASNLNVSVSQGGVESLTDDCKVISDVSFFWIYSDQDGDSQAAVRIQVDNNGDFSSPEFDSNKINRSSPLYALPVGSLGIGTYYWRLKLWDSQAKESDWFNGSSSFTVFSVQAVDFSWLPNLPFVDQTVSFVSSSIIPVSSYSWVFQNGSPAASASANPQSKFLAVGVKQVKLSAISGPKSCSVSKNVVVGGGGPL